MRALSYSQISLYQTCPLCYKLQYIDGLRPRDKWYFSFGRTMHACAEYFFQVRVPPPPTLDDLMRFYEQSWLSEGYESPGEEERYRIYGRQILADFWSVQSHDFRMPVAVEKGFYVDIDGVKLRGYFDRVDKLESGGLAIVDYKTDRELFSREHLENNLQLTLYQLAAGQVWHIPVERLTLYHLRSNTACHCEPRTEAQLSEARRLVVEVARNIAEKKFPAIENEYCPCDFPGYCPYYRQQASPELQREILPDLTPADLVERYVCLQGQIKALESEMEEVKGKIISFCQAEGLSRVYGREYALTYRLMERSGFDEDVVRALLEPQGLWQRVLIPDQAKIRGILEDDAVPVELRRQLESLKQAISSSPRLWVRKLLEE